MPTITFTLGPVAAAAYARGDTSVWTALNQRIACWARGVCCGNVNLSTGGVAPAVVVNTALCVDQGALTLIDGGTDYCTNIATDKTVAVEAADVDALDPNTCTEPALAQPTGLAAGTPTATSVPLTWTAVANAASYTVEYRTSPSGTWTAFATTPTAPTVTVTGLTASTAYDFRVTAKAPGYSDSPVSATVTATTTA